MTKKSSVCEAPIKKAEESEHSYEYEYSYSYEYSDDESDKAEKAEESAVRDSQITSDQSSSTDSYSYSYYSDSYSYYSDEESDQSDDSGPIEIRTTEKTEKINQKVDENKEKSIDQSSEGRESNRAECGDSDRDPDQELEKDELQVSMSSEKS